MTSMAQPFPELLANKLAVIADDLTGACDTACQFSLYGFLPEVMHLTACGERHRLLRSGAGGRDQAHVLGRGLAASDGRDGGLEEGRIPRRLRGCVRRAHPYLQSLPQKAVPVVSVQKLQVRHLHEGQARHRGLPAGPLAKVVVIEG